MNKQAGQITIGIGVLWTSIITTFSVAGAYFATNRASEVKATEIKEELVQTVTQETLARTIAVTELNGKFDVVNTKIDNQTQLIKELMSGLGIKYQLPQQQEEITRRVPINQNAKRTN